MGIISPIGDNLESNRKALIAGTSGISTLELFPTKYAGVLPCGEIKRETGALKQALALNDPAATRTSLLALLAFREAIKQSGLSAQDLSQSDTALINASTVGGMCLTDELYNDANKTEEPGSPFLGSYDNSAVALFLHQYHPIGGFINSINTACSSSANSIMMGARLIKQGRIRRAIVGGADSLAKFTINGFRSLHILSENPCLPFDNRRNGLNLGEGAAYLVLESEEVLGSKPVFGEVTGYGNSNDSFHPSSISDDGEGPYLSMKRALETAKLRADAIGYVNAHGTATENNDLTESRAMLRIFEKPPAFSSTKSYTGHTLGAAGAIEAVFSLLSLQNQELYPNLRFEEMIPDTGLTPVTNYRMQAIEHIMSNSFGFAGNCSSLIFSKS